MALDIKVLENGTRRKKPGNPTPRNATLVEDHPPQNCWQEFSLYVIQATVIVDVCHSQLNLIITKTAHITDMKAASGKPYFTKPRTSSNKVHPSYRR